MKKLNALGKWLVPISLFLIVMLSILGLYFEHTSFVENILSEMIGVFVSIIVASLIVERYSEYQKEQQWSSVRIITYQAITAHVCQAIADIYNYFPISDRSPMSSIIDGRERRHSNTIKGMNKLKAQLDELASEITADKSLSDFSTKYYYNVKWNLDQIRDVLTPRVIQSSNEQQLIEALVIFDDTRRKLCDAIINYERDLDYDVFPFVSGLLENARTLYEVLCDVWE